MLYVITLGLPRTVLNEDLLGLQKFLRKQLASLFFELLTPGQTPQEELAFWYVHWPHWLHDLRLALIGHGLRRPGDDPANKSDWDIFEEVIISGGVIIEGVSFTDALVTLLAEVGVNVAPDSYFNPRNFIGRIFDEVRNYV